MFRWFVIRTLLYKEVLRYRYNWGLLVMIVALLSLSALVGLSARLNKLPGQAGASVSTCYVLVPPGATNAAWAAHLRGHPPDGDLRIEYRSCNESRVQPVLPPESMAIELRGPQASALPANTRAAGTWKARYWQLHSAPVGTSAYREWFVRESQDYLDTQPRLEEETELIVARNELEPTDRIPLIFTALVVFALYLLSFNLFITSTGEEREKRILLGLLLSPVTPAEVIGAKAIFYSAASLLVALAVVSMYHPRLLLQPLLWSTLILGSVGYVAVGTVVVSLVRRQTTISTVSMLYLISTSVIMLLAQILPVFNVLRVLLVEDYLYRQLRLIMSFQSPWWIWINQAALAGLVLVWSAVAVYLFSRRGMSIAQAR